MTDPSTLQETFQKALQHQQLGQLAEAESLYRRLIVELPTNASLQVNLGNVLKDQGRTDEAIAAYETAIRISPDYAQAFYNLGLLLKQFNRLEEALAAFGKAIAIKPDYFDALNNLGTTLMAVGQLDQALDALNRAVELNPTSVTALTNLGALLGNLRRTDEALGILQRALTIDPNFSGASHNLGHVLERANLFDDAVVAYRRAIGLQPSHAPSYSDLGLTLESLGELDEAIAAYRHAMQLDPAEPRYHDNVIVALNYDPSIGAAAMLAEQKRWDARFGRRPILPRENSPIPDRPLRIGYVSADLANHAVGRNLLPLFQQHDTSNFEVFFYSNRRGDDDVTKAIRACSAHWRDIVNIADDQAAQLIRSDRIDILVDLSQHSAGNRLPLFALKPAPVQIAFAAYPGGTGLSTMDYRVSDPYLDPAANEAHYAEKTLRLPDSYWLFNPVYDDPVNELPAFTNGYVTFGCLNKFSKINNSVLNLWGRIMNATPSSRLIVLADAPSQRRRVERQLANFSIAPDRIMTIPRASPKQYLLGYQRIDLALDTFPYNGHTTSLDAFWMGVPVVTLVGPLAPGRGGWSLLNNLHLPDLAAHNDDQFVNLAAALAADLPRVAKLRNSLRQNMLDSPLTDAKRFARNLEALYRQAWESWCTAKT